MNFNKSLIGNAVLYVDEEDVGIIKSPLKVKRNVTKARQEVGTPLRLVGQVVTKEEFTLEAPMAEFDKRNIALTLANVDVVENDGSPTPVPPYLATFAVGENSSLERIVARGPNISNYAVSPPPAPPPAEPPTPYEEGVDYIVDTVRGVFYLIPGGAIDPGSEVLVSYDYAMPESSSIPIGRVQVFSQKPVRVVWTSPITGERIQFRMHRAEGDGNLDFNFADGEFQVLNLKLEALDDRENHPNEPLGGIDFLPPENHQHHEPMGEGDPPPPEEP